MSLGIYFIRRMLSFFPLMVGVSMLIFFLFAIAPVDPVNQIAGLDPGLQQNRDKIAESLGLDKPIYVRYWNWAWPMFTRLDFGDSWMKSGPVENEFVPYIANTVFLFGTAFLLILFVATVLGIVAATNHNSLFDQATLFATLIGFSIPNFVLGLVIIMSIANWTDGRVIAIYLDTRREGITSQMPAVTAAIFTLLISGLAFVTRLTRSQMLNVLRENYIRTARSKGLSERTVIYKHALRNALLPFVTVIALSLPGILSGSAIIERVFNFPGVGRRLIEAALAYDLPVVLAVTMFLAAISIFMLIVADVVYGIVDPRIKF
jgi:peptide/nickel transport system permease protein